MGDASLSTGRVIRASRRRTLWQWNSDDRRFGVTAAVGGIGFVRALVFMRGRDLRFRTSFAEAARRCGAPETVAQPSGVALATQLGTWPLTASAFLVIAPYAPLANALVVPVVGVAMLVGFLKLAVSPVPLLGVAMGNVERSLIDWILGVVRFFDAARTMNVDAPTF